MRRPFPTQELPLVDPFLLLDEMGPVDWAPGTAIGAPDHPHRGFETVTYLLEGKVVHRDSHGHAATLGPGDVQWMTAGSGVVHSEMPDREFQRGGGTMHGFQIWVNLPRAKKMMAPRYQDIPAGKSPVLFNADKTVRVRILAGELWGTRAALSTEIPITYLHVTLDPGATFQGELPADQNAFFYFIRGEAAVGPEATEARSGDLVLLDRDGEAITLTAGPQGADVLVLAATPLNEPVARYGPFVMNTPEEIRQAFADYQSGKMGTIPPGRGA